MRMPDFCPPALRGDVVRLPPLRSGASLQRIRPMAKPSGDDNMFSAIDPPEGQSLQPAGAEFWHMWTVIIPRLSIAGGLVHGRVWRRHDGRRWQYRAITEYDPDQE